MEPKWKAMPGPGNTCVIVENGSRNVAYLSHVMPDDLKLFEAAPDLLSAARRFTAVGQAMLSKDDWQALRAAIAKSENKKPGRCPIWPS